jgi:putative transposase
LRLNRFGYKSTMQIGNRFRLYPTREQAQVLYRWIGCQRFIYNSKVGEDRYFRTFARKSLALVGQHGPIDQKYAQFIGEDTAWLKDVPSVLLRNGATLWKQAYSRFFKGLGDRPGIHAKTGKQSVWLTSELFRFQSVTDEGGEVVDRKLILGTKKFPLGEVALRAHRVFDVPASIHVSVHAGQWFVSFNHDTKVPEPKDEDTAAWLQDFTQDELRSRTLGLDRGVAIPLAGSDGRDFDFLDVHQKRLAKCNKHAKHWQRIAARRNKGGRNRNKAQARVARYRQGQANIRREFAHQASHVLANDPRHLLYVFEALKVQNMTRSAKGDADNPGKNVRAKSGLNRSILASSWGQTKQYVQYKARRAGKLVVEVPPFHSSQECSQCGHTHPDNRPDQATFVCQACGHSDNADRNAARVIQTRGVKLIVSGEWQKKETKKCGILSKKVGRDAPEPALATAPTPTEFNVSREAENRFAQGTSMWEAATTSRRL